MLYNLDLKKEYLKRRESVLLAMKDIVEIYSKEKDISWLDIVKELGQESIKLKEKIELSR